MKVYILDCPCRGYDRTPFTQLDTGVLAEIAAGVNPCASTVVPVADLTAAKEQAQICLDLKGMGLL